MSREFMENLSQLAVLPPSEGRPSAEVARSFFAEETRVLNDIAGGFWIYFQKR